jgi:hypothetical protein
MYRTYRRMVALLLVLPLAGACTNDSGGGARASSSPKASAATAPATSTGALAPPTQVLAVITKGRALELYTLSGTTQPRAQRLRTLTGPAGAEAFSVTVARGPNPRVCAIWSRVERYSLRCYDGSTGRAQDMTPASGDRVRAVALSVSGQQLAWAVQEVEGRGVTLVAQRAPGGPLQRIPAYSAVQEEDILGVGDLAWSGDDTLLVSHGYDSDVNGSIARVSLDNPSRGWTEGPMVEPAMPDGESSVPTGTAASTDNGRVLAVLQILSSDPPTFRALDIDIATGQVLTIATAEKTRQMQSVSGGPAGVLYRTNSYDGEDLRTYWRAPGQQRGRPITGLPSDAFAVVAQP